MKKNRLINLLLLSVSILLSFLAAEYVLRKLLFSENEEFNFLRDPSFYAIYPHDPNEDFFNEDYWKLNYLFNRSFDLNNPNPILGWTGFFDSKTYDHWHTDTTKSKRPVLLFGDSFAMCIDSVDCFEDLLNSDSLFSRNHFLYNYGVGGYGVDQIHLLSEQVLPKYNNPFVIFSLLTTDLDRSVLKVRDAQKPYFELNNNELKLKGTPITQSSGEFFADNPPEISSYFFNRAYNVLSGKFTAFSPKSSDYIDQIKAINAAILKSSFKTLKSEKIDFVVLIFQPEVHALSDWRLSFLKDLCADNNIPYICDVDIKNNYKLKGKTSTLDFFIPNDGHPTSLANKLVAEEIKKCVLDTNYISQIMDQQRLLKENPQLKELSFAKSLIIKDDGWLNSVRDKAEANKISLDSAIHLDAQYLIDQHLVN